MSKVSRVGAVASVAVLALLGACSSEDRESIADSARETASSVQDEAHRIERTYRFKDFAEAFGFVTKAAELAETEGHHPDIGFGWGYATVSLQTKKIKGLHENDFIMAAKLDRIAQSGSPQA